MIPGESLKRQMLTKICDACSDWMTKEDERDPVKIAAAVVAMANSHAEKEKKITELKKEIRFSVNRLTMISMIDNEQYLKTSIYRLQEDLLDLVNDRTHNPE